MKPALFPLLIVIALMTGCIRQTDCSTLFNTLEKEFADGNFSRASLLADSLGKTCRGSGELIRRADSLVEISCRLKLDFSADESEFRSRLEKYYGSITDSMLAAWEQKKWIEWMMIDGEKKYFNRAASNLRLLQLFNEKKLKQEPDEDESQEMILRREHTGKIIEMTGVRAQPVMPVNMHITYRIEVNPDAVPEGETIRCWLPFPRQDHPRQTGIKLLSASEKNYIIAPDSAVHRTIYMEKKTQKGQPTTFSISFLYTSTGTWFDLGRADIKPYDREKSVYREFTAEQLPNICFTEDVRRMADEICFPGDAPETIVRKIYMWFKENIPWTGALEYSVMPCIPEYVLENRRGDCGMQTFLFMSMLRYKGIPVRWQSGWKVPPGFRNLHDWCEVYYEGPGWVPVDVSYDLQSAENQTLREFYLSGIDSWRLIVNNGVAGILYPEKKFMRSEPYDFQRGEVEWRGGNLYFDKWDYAMEIKYIDQNQ
jgi:hypothetical protein